MIEEFRVAVLVSGEAYEHTSVRSAVMDSAAAKLLDALAIERRRDDAAKSINYEWTHSDLFMLHHQRLATDVYGSDNYPRPIWLLVATMRAFPE